VEEPSECKNLRSKRTYYVYRFNKKIHKYERVTEEEKETWRGLIQEVDKKLRELECEKKIPKEFYLRCNWQVKMPRGLLLKVYAYDENDAQDLGSEIWLDYAIDPDIHGRCEIETPKQYMARKGRETVKPEKR